MPVTPSQTLLDSANCFVCLGVSMADALSLAQWDSISQNIAPPVETFNRISQVGDTRISNVGDTRIYQ